MKPLPTNCIGEKPGAGLGGTESRTLGKVTVSTEGSSIIISASSTGVKDCNHSDRDRMIRTRVCSSAVNDSSRVIRSSRSSAMYCCGDRITVSGWEVSGWEVRLIHWREMGRAASHWHVLQRRPGRRERHSFILSTGGHLAGCMGLSWHAEPLARVAPGVLRICSPF